VVVRPGEVLIDSPRLTGDLEAKLAEAFLMPKTPKPESVRGGAPLAHGGLAALRERPGEGNGEGPIPLGEAYRAAARSILGLAGYIVIQFRPDGALAYSAIAQQISPNFTSEVWRAVLQLGKYLVATKDMALTFRATGGDMAAYADSSALNGEGGHSWGGYGIGQPGSGLTHFRVLCPKQLADSSGGNELITAVLALKEVIAERIGQAELGTLPGRATDLHLDAKVVLDGVAMDRVSRESRYLAAKLSMLREAVANGVIKLTKIGTEFNPADIFTKPLVGEALARARGLVLGHPPGEPKVPKVADGGGKRSKVAVAERAKKEAFVARASAAKAKKVAVAAKVKKQTAADKAKVAFAAVKARANKAAFAAVKITAKKVACAAVAAMAKKQTAAGKAKKVALAAADEAPQRSLGPGWC
jgi:hypothetical protein